MKMSFSVWGMRTSVREAADDKAEGTTMALFDVLIDDLATRFGLGATATPLARDALALIVGGDGGIAGFLEVFKRVGLGAVATSWLGQANPAPLTPPELEKALGAPAIDPIVRRVGIAHPAATAALGYALPRLVGLLTPQGVVPSALPAEVAGFVAPADSSASGHDHAHVEEVQPTRPRSVAPVWLWPLVAIASVVGLGWGVWPILFPANPPKATTTGAAAPVPVAAPPAAEAPKPLPAPTVPSTLTLANDNGFAVISGAIHDDKTRSA